MTGANCSPMWPPSAPYSTVCFTTVTCSSAALEVGAPKQPPPNNKRRTRKRAFLDARALPSRSRDLTLYGQHIGLRGERSRPAYADAWDGAPVASLRSRILRPGAASIGRPPSKTREQNCRRRLRHGITMVVLLQFRWPVLRCPSLAAFQ